jgi:hypothetical protein
MLRVGNGRIIGLGTLLWWRKLIWHLSIFCNKLRELGTLDRREDLGLPLLEVGACQLLARGTEAERGNSRQRRGGSHGEAHGLA